MQFTASDFEIYQARFQGDADWNGRRLDIRQRLQAVGDAFVEGMHAIGLGMDRRESLHHPHASNGKRVRRQRTMIFRDKKSRKVLQSFLGKYLGKDLNSAVNNVHFQLGLDERGAYWGMRVDPGAWYDLNVLLKRAEEGPGRQEIVEACAKVDGFQLEIDRGGARPLSAMTTRDWRDLAGTVRPGESGLEIVQRMSAEAVTAAEEDFGQGVCADLLRLAPIYRLSCWSVDSPSGVSW